MVMLGWNAASEQYDPLDMLDQAVAAEKAGFESISASDHFHPWDPSGHSCNIWTWLGAAAARLNGIEIGTGYIGVPFVRIGDVVVIGFNPERFEQLFKSEKLEPAIGQA